MKVPQAGPFSLGGRVGGGALALGPQERGRHNRDSVLGASVCLGSCRDHDGVKEVISDLLAQPPEVSDIPVVGYRAELDFDRQYASVTAFNDHVDLALAREGPKMSHPGLGR